MSVVVQGPTAEIVVSRGCGSTVVQAPSTDIVVAGSITMVGSPGGTDDQLQFNDGGFFGGADLYWDGSVLAFGGQTSSDSALKGVGTALHARLGDDSGYADISLRDLTVHGGDIDVVAGALNIGASMGANALTLGSVTGHVDLPGTQLGLATGAAAPTPAGEGSIYYDTGVNAIASYDGAAWLDSVSVPRAVSADKDLVWWDLGNLRWDRTTLANLNAEFDHGALLGLADDDHDQYTLRADWNQNGFGALAPSTLAWSDSTPDRTFSIQPTGVSFSYFHAGVKYTTTGDTVQITDTEGVHAIYYDGAVLTALANPTGAEVSEIFRTKTVVSFVYWDAANSEANYVGEERHGDSMSPVTHTYEHFVEGLRYIDGLGLNTLSVDGAGATADAQFGVDAGDVSDEDLFIPITSVLSTTGLPIYHLDGAAGNLRRTVNAGFSVRTYDNTDATRLAWNEYTGGAWQLTEVDNNRYVLCHVFATTDIDSPMAAFMGQATYLSKNAAQTGAEVEVLSLVTNDIILPEIRPIATVIFKTNLSYASAVNALVVSTADGDDYVDWRSQTISRSVVSTSDHQALTNRGADEAHLQYLLIDGTRAMTGDLDAQSVYATGLLEASAAQSIGWASSTTLSAPSDGDLLVSDTAGTDIGLVQLGGETSSYPALGRSGAALDVVLADDSGYAGLNTGALLVTGTADTEQLIIKANATQSLDSPLLQLQDSAGTPLLDIHSNDPTNVFVGEKSGANITSGKFNLFFGGFAGGSMEGGGSNTAFGSNALLNCVSGNGNVAIGQGALQAYQGSNALAIGVSAGKYGQGIQNVVIGREAGLGVDGVSTYAYCVLLGFNCGSGLTTGDDNVAAGYFALNATTTGTDNAAYGNRSLEKSVDGIQNTIGGSNARRLATSGDYNTAWGYDSQARTAGGDLNTCVGSYSGRGVTGQTYNNVTAVGYATGLGLSTGSNHVLLGYGCGINLTTGDNCIIIGYNLAASSATVDNELNIGGTITGDISTGDVKIANDLEIDGTLNHDGSTAGLYGATPVAQSAAYTVTNVTPDRSYDADTVAVAELADVVGTLIADLQALGAIG